MNYDKIIIEALKEDRAARDVTTRPLAGRNDMISGTLIVKADGVLCGLDIFKKVFLILDRRCRIDIKYRDGQKVRRGQVIAMLSGPVRAILAGERTALNFLQHLSGIATLTSRFVEETRGTAARIFDTRKTLPGLRELQKYAVRCGGGNNHRMHLADMALIKDNHLKLAHGMQPAMQRIRKAYPSVKIEVECENIAQVKEAVASEADVIMLDNMTVRALRSSLRVIRGAKRKIDVEISGGVTLATVRKFACLGVNRISVGALTHSVTALDISLELD